MFQKFYKDNKSKNIILYTQVLDERLKKIGLWKIKMILMFTSPDKSRLKSLKRENSSRKQLERIKNILRELIMMVILIAKGTRAIKQTGV
jgi:thioredoxin-related protein